MSDNLRAITHFARCSLEVNMSLPTQMSGDASYRLDYTYLVGKSLMQGKSNYLLTM